MTKQQSARQDEHATIGFKNTHIYGHGEVQEETQIRKQTEVTEVQF